MKFSEFLNEQCSIDESIDSKREDEMKKLGLHLITTPYKGSIYYQKGTHKAFEWDKNKHKFIPNSHWSQSFKKSMSHPEIKNMKMGDEEKAKKLYDQNIHVHKSGSIVRFGRIGGMSDFIPHSYDNKTKKFVPVKGAESLY